VEGIKAPIVHLNVTVIRTDVHLLAVTSKGEMTVRTRAEQPRMFPANQTLAMSREKTTAPSVNMDSPSARSAPASTDTNTIERNR